MLCSAYTLIGCSKKEENTTPQPTTNNPSTPKDEISIESSITVDGKAVNYSSSSEFNISSKSLRAGDAGNLSQGSETTIILSSTGLSNDDFFEGRVFTNNDFQNTPSWQMRLYTVGPSALFLASTYTGSNQGKITVVEYKEYTDSDGDKNAGKITLRFDNFKVQDQSTIKTINGNITIIKYIY